MKKLEMCGEEIVRLASSRRNGSRPRRVVPGDALHQLIRVALNAADPVLGRPDPEPGFLLG